MVRANCPRCFAGNGLRLSRGRKAVIFSGMSSGRDEARVVKIEMQRAKRGSHVGSLLAEVGIPRKCNFCPAASHARCGTPAGSHRGRRCFSRNAIVPPRPTSLVKLLGGARGVGDRWEREVPIAKQRPCAGAEVGPIVAGGRDGGDGRAPCRVSRWRRLSPGPSESQLREFFGQLRDPSTRGTRRNDALGKSDFEKFTPSVVASLFGPCVRVRGL